ncbi:MAG: GGDEF domain-containing protein [Muricomes sp.]
MTEGSITHHYSVSIHPLFWNQNNILAFVFADISPEREKLEQLQSIANIDTLTQLYNRRYGMGILEKWIFESRAFVLCFIDINNLKFVNDRYGHVEGDKYIVRVSNTIRKFNEEAVVCRIGGDEFMLLAENWSVEAAEERLEVLQSELKDCGCSYECSISYGIIPVVTGNRSHANELLSIADEKMYEYKRAYKLLRKNKPR